MQHIFRRYCTIWLMAPVRTPTQRLIDLARRRGVLRLVDATSRGIHAEYVRRLMARGDLVRAGRGLYILADSPLDANHTLAEASRRVPSGVVCLLSALRFHELGTQSPRQVWMAISPRARKPRIVSPPIRFVRFSGAALTEGVERHKIDGVTVRVFGAAKTVADCFRYRRKIGHEVALEALKDYLRAHRGTTERLLHYARIRGVAKRVSSYLEALS